LCASITERQPNFGGLNWNDNAFENNREVVLLLHGEAVAGYYERVFEADWRGGIDRLPVGLVAALVVVVAVAALVGRRIDFENDVDGDAADSLDWEC
jgi:phosphatidylserine/phosphatidylglycerophosphate/cardiolipin synthase-like enzyme